MTANFEAIFVPPAVIKKPFKDDAQTAIFKAPVRTAL